MSNILICPLDWGMGHATRVQQVAAYLHTGGHNVTIAASPYYLDAFGKSVCSNKITFKSFRIRYSSFIPQYIFILLQAPVLIIQFIIDYLRVAGMVRKHKIDIVISDNRFGAFSSRAYCVYITHQLQILSPWNYSKPGPLMSYVHNLIASLYNEIWVPDINSWLTGALTQSNRHPGKLHNIGALSMLQLYKSEKPPSFPEGEYLAVILSGPEPQRSLLEKKLLRELAGDKRKYVFAGGKIKGSGEIDIFNNITLYKYLSPSQTRYLLEKSNGVICRAGYSTIMDLVKLNKSALLIPTPGQTEQEYLAGYLTGKGLFSSLKQEELQLPAIAPAKNKINAGDYLKECDKYFRETLNGLIRRSSSQ